MQATSNVNECQGENWDDWQERRKVFGEAEWTYTKNHVRAGIPNWVQGHKRGEEPQMRSQ